MQLRSTHSYSYSPRPAASIWAWSAVTLSASLLAACGSGASDLDDSPLGEDDFGVLQNQIVGPITTQFVLSAETQLETRPGGPYQLITTANVQDFSKISYTLDTRHVDFGASFMSWRSSGPGAAVVGTVTPPSGWAVFWGDPSMTTDRTTGAIFIADLAIPSSKFPSGGIDGEVTTTTPTNFGRAYIGGACVSRSFNGGASFTSQASRDCMTRTSSAFPFGMFYDGSSMTSDRFGRTYAAFRNATLSEMDVYRAVIDTDPMLKLPDPHPNLAWADHPRIRATRDGGLLLMGRGGSDLLLTRYDGGGSSGTWTTPTVVASNVSPMTRITFSGVKVRTGPQYAFDVGKNESGQDEIRILYSFQDGNGRLHLKGSKCNVSPPITCSNVSAWSTSSTAGDQWNPLVAYGEINGTHTWAMSYYDRSNNPNGDTMEVWGGRLTNSGSSRSRLVAPYIACPDERDYLGDYDDLDFDRATNTRFVRGFTYTPGTCVQTKYLSSITAATIIF